MDYQAARVVSILPPPAPVKAGPAPQPYPGRRASHLSIGDAAPHSRMSPPPHHRACSVCSLRPRTSRRATRQRRAAALGRLGMYAVASELAGLTDDVQRRSSRDW
jgi:hypothetical protein